MEFRIADTFTNSLARLTAEEQKAAKTTAFDLQLNPALPGLQFHRLDKVKDRNFWSVRVSADVRLIVHRTETSMLLCFVDHHNEAYRWAERRKLETHPKTGAAQLVEIRERVQEVMVPKYVEEQKPLLFAKLSADQLLSYGVPAEWVDDVHKATEDSLLELADHLPAEAAEALLNLATGVSPAPSKPSVADPFQHPDAQRRFRLMGDVEELQRALDYPWDKWTVFLHPEQRQLVIRDYQGPARVSGSAGTGKTIVALHRAVHLARSNPESRVLLTTFSDALSNALHTKFRRLIGNQPRLAERLEVHAMNTIGRRLFESNFGRPQVASRDTMRAIVNEAAVAAGPTRFPMPFLFAEWEDVVDAWGLETWESYRDVVRLGRKIRLPEKQRAYLWSIFERVRVISASRNLITPAEIFSRLGARFGGKTAAPFDFVVVDEAQDIGIAQLRFLAAIGAGRPNALFFAGDLGQRIFQQPFSWKALGIDLRGRSTSLKINYRTSHQIRTQADRLLGPSVSDVDGNTEERKGTISVFNGALPQIQVLTSAEGEIQTVGDWLRARSAQGVLPHEMSIFVRSEAGLPRARAAVERAGLPFQTLDEHVETVTGRVSIGTMHLAKGLEFRAVAVMACDDEIVPLKERVEAVADDADLEEVYNTERHLLYVACTRARDHLLVTGVQPASEFLDDLRGK